MFLIRKTFPLLLILVGIAQMAGFYLQSSSLQKFGRLSGASPFAVVFNDLYGFEYWSTQMKLRVTLQNGVAKEVPFDSHIFNGTSPGHYVELAYAIPYAMSVSSLNVAWKQSLHYNFCEQGPLHKELKLNEKVSSVVLLLKYRALNEHRELSKEVRCE